MRRLVAAGLLVGGGLFGCGSGCEDPVDKPQVATEIFAAMGEPMPAATEDQLEAFERGRRVSLRRFSPDDGLGPKFNVTFCTGCHEQPDVGGSSPRYRNFYLTGTQLSDGSTVLLGASGVQRQFSTEPPHRVPTDEQANFTVTRNAIPFFGVGALAEVPEESILEHADPDDADDDGISGRPNWDRGFVGRFGRKAQTVSIEGFIRGPMFNHLGVTSNPLSNARKAELPVPSDLSQGRQRILSAPGSLADLGFCPNCQAAAPEEPLEDSDGIPDPELGQDDLFDLVSFTMLLAAPEPEELSAGAKEGKAIFAEAGCDGCHVPGLEGPRGVVMAYTDLLLHDMGPELADGIEQGVATGAEFRTQPLWGVVATGPYLHDGRADTLDAAIRMHAGEAGHSRDVYAALDEAERESLLEFLRSLGGRDQESEGLLAPDSEVPSVGEYGGPTRQLDAEEAELFARGRVEFDRDATLEGGLGPLFNGDSCRACHFEPTLGGAGPAGVSVTRQGVIDPDTGEFFAPEGGTLLHRLTTDFGRRPSLHPDANVIELRQTPPLYGLGLVDRISEAVIAANEDPDDTDGDGISGRASRRDDGRIGRFGWKAAFPTLEDFVRDALSNETGLTVPAGSAFVAGSTHDADAISDPEFSGTRYQSLVFYSKLLDAPPTRDLDESEKRGESLFGEVGCDGCHRPALETGDGDSVPLYSDLLLHDVAPADYRGVGEGAATSREFRTPPLWGIGDTAPYMHDGLSGTLDAAIRRHQAEASSVVADYEALSDQQRSDLIAFLEAL